MIREHLFHKRIATDPMFRWRGGEISRLEGLSDGVFALSLTLLVMSTEVPGTFYELWRAAVQLPIFVACFAMLMMAWRYHYLFFRRYGLEDLPTTVLNAVYLFLLLFLAFPLKFLATFLFRVAAHEPVGAMFAVPPGVEFQSDFAQRGTMMVFYGAAILGVFGTQALMLAWAWRRRHDLELDRLERFLTRSSMLAHGITCAIATASIVVVVTLGNPGIAGVVYFAMPFAHGAHGWWSGRRAAALQQQLAAQA
ncbi:MAG: DUF1211 domain-containing protein [Planctomycetes bacterium]|nr:DUF1211 domain-containing protein [Planctomycetota bacterium]